MVNCQHYTNSKEGRPKRTNELSENKLAIPSCQDPKQDGPKPVEPRNRDNSAQKPEWIYNMKVNNPADIGTEASNRACQDSETASCSDIYRL